MAIALVTFTVADRKNKKSSVTFWSSLNGGGLNDKLTDVIEYWQEVARRMDALVTGAIVSISISIQPTLPTGIKIAPQLNSDVEERALLIYPADNRAGYTPVGFRHEIPTFNHALFDTGTTLSEADNAALAAFVGLLVNPTDLADWPGEYGEFVDSRGKMIGLFSRAEKRFRRS